MTIKSIKTLSALLLVTALIFSGCSLTSVKSNSQLSSSNSSSDSKTDSFTEDADSGASSTASVDEEESQASSHDQTSSSTAANSEEAVPSLPEGGEYITSLRLTDIPKEQRYCYTKLSATAKKAYDVIYRLVKDFSGERVLIEGVTRKDISVAYNAVRIDNPEFFWMGYNFAVIQETKGNKVTYGISVNGEDYGFIIKNKAQKDSYQKILELGVDKILTTLITDKMAEQDCVLAIHNYVCRRVSYNYESKVPTESTKFNWTAYGALVDATAVCEGYSRAMQIMLYRLGVQNTLILGIGDGNPHMWNAVYIDGDWSYTDVTWDDTADKTVYKYYKTQSINPSSKHKAYEHYSGITDESKLVSGVFNIFNEG